MMVAAAVAVSVLLTDARFRFAGALIPFAHAGIVWVAAKQNDTNAASQDEMDLCMVFDMTVLRKCMRNRLPATDQMASVHITDELIIGVVRELQLSHMDE